MNKDLLLLTFLQLYNHVVLRSCADNRNINQKIIKLKLNKYIFCEKDNEKRMILTDPNDEALKLIYYYRLRKKIKIADMRKKKNISIKLNDFKEFEFSYQANKILYNKLYIKSIECLLFSIHTIR